MGEISTDLWKLLSRNPLSKNETCHEYVNVSIILILNTNKEIGILVSMKSGCVLGTYAHSAPLDIPWGIPLLISLLLGVGTWNKDKIGEKGILSWNNFHNDSCRIN